MAISIVPKFWIAHDKSFAVVGERSADLEAVRATDRGARGSEDADISNVKGGEIPPRRKSKVSWATIVVPGLVGT